MPAAHQVFLTAGETLNGIWEVTDDQDPPEPQPLAMVAAVAFREYTTDAIDWSALVTQAPAGTLLLAALGADTAALTPGRWTVQIWAALVADQVPDFLIASIDLRVNMSALALPALSVAGVAV